MVIEVLGWIGAFLLVLAYFLLVHHDLTNKSKMYQLMNLFGSILLGINSLFNHAYPSVISNIFWFLIAIYGLSKAFLYKKRK